jgi:hypothetical protein
MRRPKIAQFAPKFPKMRKCGAMRTPEKFKAQPPQKSAQMAQMRTIWQHCVELNCVNNTNVDSTYSHGKQISRTRDYLIFQIATQLPI